MLHNVREAAVGCFILSEATRLALASSEGVGVVEELHPGGVFEPVGWGPA